MLALSGELFEPARPGEPGFQMPRFFHSRFAEFIREEVQREAIESRAGTLLEVETPGATEQQGETGTVPPPEPETEPPGGDSASGGRTSPLVWLALGLAAILLIAGALFGLTRIYPPPLPATPVAIATIISTLSAEGKLPLEPDTPLPASPTLSPTPGASQTPRTSPAPPGAPSLAHMALVSAASSALLAAPVDESAILLTLERGDTLQIFGRNQDGDWLAAILTSEGVDGNQSGGGRSGWIRTEHVTLDYPLELLPEVLALPTLTPTGAAPPLAPTATATPTRRPRPPSTDAPPPPTPYP